MELNKHKYYEHVEANVRPIIEKHNLLSHKKKYILNKILSFISSDLNNYKNDRKKDAKEAIFSELLKFFGDFEFKRDHTLPFQYLQNSMIIPEHTGYASEDRITGVFNNTKIDIAEIALVKRSDEKNIAVFKGLVIVLDICNSNLVLRGSFKGNTVLFADHKKHLDYIKKKFKGYKRLEPPVKHLEDRFEMYTTDEKEANKIICKKLLKSFISLSEYIGNLQEQITHSDDKHELFCKQLKKEREEQGNKNQPLWWEKVVDEVSEVKTAKLSDIYKEDPLYGTSEMESLNNDIACSFYGDKVLLTIRHPHDLFEPNPINEDPIIDEDIELMYHLMSAVCEITNVILENKSSKK
ncbi:MAG: hypothetical protein COV35_02860 [Alphaproteobacteria bacterium CG11_big_fil_rev_8_21_14_0_20_39_49]|nr:MAG: hypothetical protein COV35_02860 [Alphaproteobacteria bacterium CG11_big_fil_rev_8_21_14_0_20_39_49]